MIRLYHQPGACSTVARMGLEEAGADYEIVPVAFARAEQRGEAYRAINPLGRVPVLETGEGRLTECLAILDWIARRWPEKRLAPLEDPWGMAQMLSFNAFLASSLHPANAHFSRPERYADGEAAQAAMKAKAPAAIAGLHRIVEARLQDGRGWVLGEAYSLCDPYLMWLTDLAVMRQLLDLDEFPLTAAHQQRTRERPAVRRVFDTGG
jgi:glutathione S-transferase